MPKFRKIPVVIEAHQFGGSLTEIAAFNQWIDGGEFQAPARNTTDWQRLLIPTDSGMATVTPGDWVIKGTAGEFYPCKPEIFATIYEPAE